MERAKFGSIGRMYGKKLYNVHYTLLGRLVYHLCKLETQQLKNMVDNVVNLSKVKRKRRTIKQKRLPVSEYPRLKRVRKMIKQKKKRKFSRKQLAAQRLFAKRARAGTLRKRRRR